MRENCSPVYTLAIIPARGGSKGLPRKNVRLLAGKPLVAHSIEVALRSKVIDRVVVSTEDTEIADLSRPYGADVIMRPLELAQDDTPSLPVLQHVIRHLADARNLRPEVIVLLQPTSPLRTEADIEAAVQLFLKTRCSSVVGVCEVEHPLEWMYTMSADRLEPVMKEGHKVARRQDAAGVYRLNGAVYVTRPDLVMKQGRMLGKDTRGYVMPSDRSIDIDTELDLKLAELLISERG